MLTQVPAEPPTWTPWRSWDGGPSGAPDVPGLYRVRTIGLDCFDYIGQTGSIRARFGNLRSLFAEEMPLSDPHTAAPCLWVLRTQLGSQFELSWCPVAGDKARRMALETVAVSLHRAEFGVSPTANFGRMPEGWSKSTGNNAALQMRGKVRRGFADATQHRSADFPCMLDDVRPPTHPNWAGLEWSAWGTPAYPATVGVYRVRANDSEGGLLYVGQGDLAGRIGRHLATWAAPYGPGAISWVSLDGLAPAQLLEVENDLIASHVLGVGVPPLLQFSQHGSS